MSAMRATATCYKPLIVSLCSKHHLTYAPKILLLKTSHIHSYNLSKSMQLVTVEKLPITPDYQVMNPSDSCRPLILLYSWTMSKDRNVMKYVKLYTDIGFDVLKIRTLIPDLLFPRTGSQIVAADVLKFLHANPSFNPLFVHGFSVGAYAFGEAMVKMENEKPRHDEVKNRFVGQIWDSPVDVYGLPNALAKAVSNNSLLQTIIDRFLTLYLKLNYRFATKFYNRSSDMIHQNTLGVPGLFLYSKGDVSSTTEMNEFIINKWRKRHELVYTKCFDNSVHVGHLMKYPEDYKTEVFLFLERTGLIQSQKYKELVHDNYLK